MSLGIIPGRHHRDGNGVLRHMHGRHMDRALPDSHKNTAHAPRGAAFAAALFLSAMTQVRRRDQGSLGCCVGETYAEIADMELVKLGKLTPDTEHSELNAYDAVRIVEGTPLTEDSGAQGGDMMEAAHHYGVCSSKLKPFSDDPAVWGADITDEQRTDAAKRKLVLSLVCPTHESIKHALTQGFAVATGFTCFESLMSPDAARTGFIPYPERGERAIGGHEMAICGWDDNMTVAGRKGAWILRQHWDAWGATIEGLQSYGYLPYDYQVAGLMGDNHSPRLLDVAA